MEVRGFLGILFGLFLIVESKPQTDYGLAISQDDEECSVIIEEEEVLLTPEVDYNFLGDTNACGYSDTWLGDSSVTRNGNGRIREWPWIAAFLTWENKNAIGCAGVLITSRHVLSAAHCFGSKDGEVLKPYEFFVRLGEYDFKRDGETQLEDINVTEVRIHEEYLSDTQVNDISIVYLEKAVHYSIYVQPICLPLPLEVFTGSMAVVKGWGYQMRATRDELVNKILLQPNILHEVQIPVWARERCDEWPHVNLKVLCAGSDGKDACVYDSGGPLVTQRKDGRWVTIGIVSYGYGCAIPGKPGIYTEVSKFLDWIATKIKD